MSRANSATIDELSPVPNGILAFALDDVSSAVRPRPPAYVWTPDGVICPVYYEVLMSCLDHALPGSFPFESRELFCAAASCAHSECTAEQYSRNLVRMRSFVEPFEAATGEKACLLPLSFAFAVFYVTERFKELTANGDSIRKEFAGLLYLHSQMGWDCVVSMPLFDSVFAGFNRGLTSLSEVTQRRGFHPSTVAIVLELMLSDRATSAVVETGALLLFAYLFWFRPCSFRALTLEHVQIFPNSLLVTEVARKATGSSAKERAASRTKIDKRVFPFVQNSRVGLAIVKFFELAVARATSPQSPLFLLSTEPDMNCALQRLLVAAFALQPGSNASTEFTVYSGRIGGLTAAKLLGASAEQINVWGGWVQGGTSWAPYLRPDIHFANVPADVLFAKACFGHLLPVGVGCEPANP